MSFSEDIKIVALDFLDQLNFQYHIEKGLESRNYEQ